MTLKTKAKRAKAIAVILIFRLVISLVAGAVLGLSVSQMKIITYRVYRLYSRATYGFLWKRPQVIETPMLLTASFDNFQIAKL